MLISDGWLLFSTCGSTRNRNIKHKIRSAKFVVKLQSSVLESDPFNCSSFVQVKSAH